VRRYGGTAVRRYGGKAVREHGAFLGEAKGLLRLKWVLAWLTLLYNILVHHRTEQAMTTTTYSRFREKLADYWDEVEESRGTLIVERRGREELAVLPAEELRSLQETAHLLRSPANAARLLTALTRSRRKKGTKVTLAQLQHLLEK
jgi:antitoxin YefM